MGIYTPNSPAKSTPLLGICDLTRHRFRPVVLATTKCEGGRKELDILMVCSRCGYAREARQLQQASEQLARDVMADAEKQADQEVPDASHDSPGAETCDDEDQQSAAENKARTKIN